MQNLGIWGASRDRGKNSPSKVPYLEYFGPETLMAELVGPGTAFRCVLSYFNFNPCVHEPTIKVLYKSTCLFTLTKYETEIKDKIGENWRKSETKYMTETGIVLITFTLRRLSWLAACSGYGEH